MNLVGENLTHTILILTINILKLMKCFEMFYYIVFNSIHRAEFMEIEWHTLHLGDSK